MTPSCTCCWSLYAEENCSHICETLVGICLLCCADKIATSLRNRFFAYFYFDIGIIVFILTSFNSFQIKPAISKFAMPICTSVLRFKCSVFFQVIDMIIYRSLQQHYLSFLRVGDRERVGLPSLAPDRLPGPQA